MKGGAPYRSANSGELSPEAHGRADIKQFWAGGKRFKNIEPAPLSGFRLMPGSVDNGPVRRRVATLAKTGESATPGPHAGAQVIWQANVTGSPCAIDCAALAALAGEVSVQAQVLSGAVWSNLGSPIVAGTLARAITFAAAPGAAIAGTAVRLVGTFGAAGTVNCGTVTVLEEGATLDRPRYSALTHDSGDRYFIAVQAGFADIFRDDAFVAGAWLPDLTAAILPETGFYAESGTLGLAHRTMATQRLRRGPVAAEWSRDLWPYQGIPKVDLGAAYVTHDDVWAIDVKWANTPFVYLSVTVNGETTPGIPYVKADGDPAQLGTADVVDWTLTAANIQDALEALPSLGAAVSVVFESKPGKAHTWHITFGGALSGAEYGVTASINNTADAAALTTHIDIGKTDYEPLLSVARGWPGVFGFAGDRLAYGDIAAVPSALAFSAAGEYFNINIEAAGAAAAVLHKLRGGQISERVLAFSTSTYLLVFTAQGVHFLPNRTISALEPPNFVQVPAPGIVANTEPLQVDGKTYYLAIDPASAKSGDVTGHQLLSLGYSEIETTFAPVPESLLAGHLVRGVIRIKAQLGASEAEASRLWMLRQDGRLACGCIITSQEVTGIVEWLLAANGLAREIQTDAGNDLRLCVERGGVLRHERLDRSTWLQAMVIRTADLAGKVTGLDLHEGRQVWAVAEGHVLGPFTVAGGEIELGDAWAGDIQIGLWTPPVWESLPRLLVLPNDEVVKRPGRIHSATLELIGTTSLAIGANTEVAQNVPLGRAGDPAEAPLPPRDGPIEVPGMLGAVTGTTLVVTQVRPGALQVRDITIGERL